MTCRSPKVTRGDERDVHGLPVGTEWQERHRPLRHRQQHCIAAKRLHNDIGDPHLRARGGDAVDIGSGRRRNVLRDRRTLLREPLFGSERHDRRQPGVATILNDDAAPSLAIDDASRIEGNSGSANMTFTVRLAPASGSTVTVSYATSDASATALADYLSRTGTVTFSAGQTSRTFTVPVVGDTLDEDDETFVVGLSTPTNATILDTQGTGTIVDNDASPSISINNVTVTEGNAGTVPAAFSVTMSRASGRVVSVDYATTDLTATGPADYTPTSGTLTFAPGQITKTITVDVMGELLNELTEAYRVTLSNPVNVTVTTATGTGTITNDDPSPPSGPAISRSPRATPAPPLPRSRSRSRARPAGRSRSSTRRRTARRMRPTTQVRPARSRSPRERR